MEEKKSSFMNVSGTNNFKIISIEKDPDFPNHTIVRLTQAINDIPLRGTQIILHIDENNIVKVILGSINPNYIKPDYDVNIIYHDPEWGNWDVLINANSENIITKINNIID